jgi:hypothetical protein
MSVLYYCDGPGCVKKLPGRVTSEGWTGPEGWLFHHGEEKILDGCSEECYDKALEAAYPLLGQLARPWRSTPEAEEAAETE